MRRVDMLGITGVAMLLGGLAMFLSEGTLLPLWVTWTVGPLFWYLGFAVMLVWGYQQFFGHAAQEQAPESMPDAVEPVRRQLRIRQVSRPFGAGPAGVIHEIPAMGGFIL
jgi:hypothetical protein